MASVVDSGRLRHDFLLERQEQGNWCWATIAAALALYFHGRHHSQCSIVQAARNPPGVNCCETPDHPECDVVERISVALARVGVARRSNPPQPEGQVSYDVIQQDIDNDRPLVCLMSGNQGDHYVVIVGWFLPDGMPWLIVDDPADGLRRRVSYSDFFNFRGRSWDQTTRLA